MDAASRGTCSDAELLQVMVEMLVAHDGPLDGGHGAEEAVRMGCALAGAPRREAVDPIEEASLLLGRISFIFHSQAVVRGHIGADWFFSQHGFLCHLSDDSPEEASRRVVQSRGHFHSCGTAGQHLGDGHDAPLSCAVRPQSFDALLDFRCGRGFKEVLHGHSSLAGRVNSELAARQCVR